MAKVKVYAVKNAFFPRVEAFDFLKQYTAEASKAAGTKMAHRNNSYCSGIRADSMVPITIPSSAIGPSPNKTIIVAGLFIFAERYRSDAICAGAEMRLGAHSVTVQIVVCGAWFGSVVFIA